MKAKVKCVAILAYGLEPFAVIVATIAKHKYILLGDELRAELSHVGRDPKIGRDYGAFTKYPPFDVPALLRSHVLEVETGEVAERGLKAHAGIWSNGETLWVHESVALLALEDLLLWRNVNAPRDGSISASNWRHLTAVRALAIGAGLADPGVQAS